MSRRFAHAGGDRIKLGLGSGASLTGDITLAAIVFRPNTGLNVTEVMLRVGETSVIQTWINGGGGPAQLIFFTGTSCAGPNLPLGTWVCMVISKAAGGSSVPRFHLYNYSTNSWSHTNSVTATGNVTPDTACYIGGYSDGTSSFEGDIAVVGTWAANFTDTQAESLAFDLNAWFQVSPNGLWVLDQASTSMNVIDVTGGGANQTSLVGTSIGSNVSVFSYGHPILYRLTLPSTPPPPTGAGFSTVWQSAYAKSGEIGRLDRTQPIYQTEQTNA